MMKYMYEEKVMKIDAVYGGWFEYLIHDLNLNLPFQGLQSHAFALICLLLVHRHQFALSIDLSTPERSKRESQRRKRSKINELSTAWCLTRYQYQASTASSEIMRSICSRLPVCVFRAVTKPRIVDRIRTAGSKSNKNATKRST